MSYKDTLNLPQTDFPMKANLPSLEPRILEFWNKINIYKEVLNLPCNGKYILHDGPPYANGDIHIGHALNKSLKDIVVKFMTMKRKKSIFLPGWDCHGLPVEYALFKKLGKTKHEVDILDFRKRAYDYAIKYVEIQKKEFKRLGVFGLWDEPYLTLDPKYEAIMLKALAKLVEKGYVYRGLKPVNWCSKCETALAEAEVEYEMEESPSLYMKFPLLEQSSNRNTYFLVWTTTPWTLLGNVGCALNPNLTYVKFTPQQEEENTECYIVVENLLSEIIHKANIKDYKIIEKCKGKELKGRRVKHPFLDRESKLILSDFVSGEEGTGCVHIAPGHGEEDYEVGEVYNLPMYMPVDDTGKFVSKYKNLNKNLEGDNKVHKTPEWLVGKNVFEANNLIIDKLKSDNKLLYREEITHSYPTCWRCKTPIIFRATKQWFMSIDHDGLRDKVLKFCSKVKWIPAAGKDRFMDMIRNRPDWCLSRQRLWGVPIPALTCLDCNEEIISADIIKKVAECVQEEGSDIWFKQDLKELISDLMECPFCGSTQLEKLSDIIDVWFESGISHLAVLKENSKLLTHPADLYLEGSDQHRGWFQTSMLISMATLEKPPFKTILTHGFVVDAEGKKMSKSKGNVVTPLDIFKQYGADILRLWVVSCDYTSDVKISNQIISNVAEAYRKIRNTIKFLLGNLYDFSLHDKVDYNLLLEIDKWVLLRIANLLQNMEEKYKNFDFYKIYRCIYDFCILDLSNFYLDILKDRLYIYKEDCLERRSAQTAIYYTLIYLVKLVAPIMPFTSEEVWQHLPKGLKSEHKNSVHLEKFPELNKEWIDEKLEQKWQRLLNIRDKVLKALEIKRGEGLIGSSLEAKITLYTDEEELIRFLDTFEYDLRYVFIVSDFNIVKVNNLSEVKNFTLETDNMKLKVDKAEGQKCQRCWNYSKLVGKNNKYPDLCERCISQLIDQRR